MSKKAIAGAIAGVVATLSNFSGQTPPPTPTPVEAVRQQTIQIKQGQESAKAGKQETTTSSSK